MTLKTAELFYTLDIAIFFFKARREFSLCSRPAAALLRRLGRPRPSIAGIYGGIAARLGVRATGGGFARDGKGIEAGQRGSCAAPVSSSARRFPWAAACRMSCSSARCLRIPIVLRAGTGSRRPDAKKISLSLISFRLFGLENGNRDEYPFPLFRFFRLLGDSDGV